MSFVTNSAEMVRPKCKVPVKSAKKATPTAAKATLHASPTTGAGKGNYKSKAAGNVDVPICCGCGIYVTDEVRALQCDRCQASEGWKCTDCLNISKTM